jgi:hypothetical protein
MPGFEGLWFNRVEVMMTEAEATVSRALRAAGWKHTSQTPGSRWMWERELDGVVYRVSRDDAATMQERFDREAYFKQYPDELSD